MYLVRLYAVGAGHHLEQLTAVTARRGPAERALQLPRVRPEPVQIVALPGEQRLEGKLRRAGGVARRPGTDPLDQRLPLERSQDPGGRPGCQIEVYRDLLGRPRMPLPDQVAVHALGQRPNSDRA
jgi:hypothetical protein